MLWASPPAAGADADGRFDVDSVLVTEFLLSFVGTLAGLKLSSDIAACIQRALRFQSFLGQGRFQEDMNRLRPPPQPGRSAYCLDDVNKRSTSCSAAHGSNQSNGLRVMKPVPLGHRAI